MPLYLTADRLKLAIDRLRESRAATGMINFLILKRAVALKPEDGYIRFSTKDKLLQQAIDELALWPASDGEADRPFVNVFGSMNAKNNGTMTKKYRSNGPSDTLRNQIWGSIVETKQVEECLAGKLSDNYREALARQTLVRDEKRPMPRLSDAAIWYFRGQDIEPLIGAERNTESIEKIITNKFCEQLGLDAADIEILFDSEH